MRGDYQRLAADRKRTLNVAIRELMNRLLIVAILIISTAPLYAQRQQQSVAKLKADARNVVGTIANDKAKTQTYCQILDLARQLAQAAQEKDRKKAKTLVERIDQLRKQLAEFVALSNIVEQVDLNSPDGREIALIIPRSILSGLAAIVEASIADEMREEYCRRVLGE